LGVAGGGVSGRWGRVLQSSLSRGVAAELVWGGVDGPTGRWVLVRLWLSLTI
jgi:hypothetical protein